MINSNGLATTLTTADYSSYYSTGSIGYASYPETRKTEDKTKTSTVSIPKVKGIYPQLDKRLCVVKFDDNSIVKLHCHEEDEFDVEIATALAIAYKVYGAKGEFRRQVEKISGIKKGE